MVTLKDIANHAGVSVSAASLALRDHRSISLETKQRVWVAQEKLGYHRHANIRLKKRAPKGQAATRNIAFVLVGRQFKDLAYAEIFEAIASVASSQGFLPTYLSAKPEDLREGKFPLSLKNREVDGIIVSGLYDEVEHRQLKRLGIPILVYGNYDLGAEAWAGCEIDNRAGIRLMVDRLSELGHRRFGLLLCTTAVATREQIQMTYAQCIAKNGVTDVGIATVEGDENIRNSLTALLTKPERPTALVVPLLGEAVHAYEVCHDLGLRIPEDISVICYGLRQEHLRPSLSTVQAHYEEIAQGAVNKLTRLMDDPDQPLTREIFGMRFVPGGSIGPVPDEAGAKPKNSTKKKKAS